MFGCPAARATRDTCHCCVPLWATALHRSGRLGRDRARLHVVRRQSGALWSWGTNGRGELATGDESPQATPGLRRGLSAAAVAAGDHYSLALLASGDVYHWGDGVGPSPLPLGLGNVRQLATGSGYSLAVTRDGSVVEWGRARISQTVLSR